MSTSARRQFVIGLCPEEEAGSVHAFHEGTLDEFLLPRTRKEFDAFAAQGALYRAVEVLEGGRFRLVGLCYITEAKSDDGTLRWEFGGVYVEEDCRAIGLATTIGMAAISNHLVWNFERKGMRLIGHVHEFNDKPRKMLGRLGFRQVGQEPLPKEIAPASMKRNADDEVIGHLFEFDRKALADFAARLEAFNGSLPDASVEVHLPIFGPLREHAVTALRELAR